MHIGGIYLLTIQDLLQHSQFPGLTLVAGHHKTDNSILSVNVLENPGILDWLGPGELLLTTGYAFKNEPSLQKEMLIELVKQNGAGIGFKIQRYFEEVPKELIQLADKINLPIIAIPYHYTFSEISGFINEQLRNDTFNISTEEAYLHQQIYSLVEQGANSQILIENLAQKINNPILILDSQLNFTHSYDLSQNKIRISDTLAKETDEQSFKQQLTYKMPELLRFYQGPFALDVVLKTKKIPLRIYPILKENRVFYYLITWNTMTKLSPKNLLHIKLTSQYLLPQLQLEQLKNKIVSEERHFLFFDLVKKKSRSTQDIHDFCSHYQLDIDGTYTLMTLRLKLNAPKLKKEKANQIFYYLNYLIGGYKEKILCIDYRDSFIFIIENQEQEPQLLKKEQLRIAQSLLNKLKQQYPNLDFLLAISSARTNVKALSNSYEENKQIIHSITKKQLRGHRVPSIVFYQDIRFNQLLENYLSKESRQAFITNFLSPLLAHDQLYKTDYVQTLSTYFQTQRNRSLAAKELHVHRNTLMQRLKKIEQLLMISLDEKEPSLALEFSLYLFNELN
ncbi:PucR family transcriptional regulator [Vagococcus sp.]|uniref:PucR family transcriptional regulator n=1 Tax=Vagococcus sp. TaxID=1933889 RepID=UPI003F962C36